LLRFQFLTVVTTKTVTFWKASKYPETSVNFYLTVWHHIPDPEPDKVYCHHSQRAGLCPRKIRKLDNTETAGTCCHLNVAAVTGLSLKNLSRFHVSLKYRPTEMKEDGTRLRDRYSWLCMYVDIYCTGKRALQIHHYHRDGGQILIHGCDNTTCSEECDTWPPEKCVCCVSVVQYLESEETEDRTEMMMMMMMKMTIKTLFIQKELSLSLCVCVCVCVWGGGGRGHILFNSTIKG
jgi:hypothetical protein